MTFAELTQELSDRGFAHLDATRRGRFVNWACSRLDRMARWPYREMSATGSPPLAIADLGVIEMVINAGTNLAIPPANWQNLVESYGDLSVAGAPLFYYLAQPGGGSTEVATFPVGASDLISVQYWKVTSELSGASDEPLSPSDFHDLIVDMACQYGYRDAGDWASADALQPAINERKAEMLAELLVRQAQGADIFVAPIGDDC